MKYYSAITHYQKTETQESLCLKFLKLYNNFSTDATHGTLFENTAQIIVKNTTQEKTAKSKTEGELSETTTESAIEGKITKVAIHESSKESLTKEKKKKNTAQDGKRLPSMFTYCQSFPKLFFCSAL